VTHKLSGPTQESPRESCVEGAVVASAKITVDVSAQGE